MTEVISDMMNVCPSWGCNGYPTLRNDNEEGATVSVLPAAADPNHETAIGITVQQHQLQVARANAVAAARSKALAAAAQSAETPVVDDSVIVTGEQGATVSVLPAAVTGLGDPAPTNVAHSTALLGGDPATYGPA